LFEKRNFKFTKQNRLLKKTEFDAVFRNKISASDQNIIVYFKSNTLKYNRLGIVIGKKVAIAAKRNRFKRIVREAFRKNEISKSFSFDIVVLPRKPLNESLKSTDISESLTALLERLITKNKIQKSDPA